MLIIVGCNNNISRNYPQETENWQTIDAKGRFSFRLPQEFIEKDTQGIDSYVGEFVGDSMKVTFDYGWYSNPLNDLESMQEYFEFNKKIEGFKAKIVGYKLNQNYYYYYAYFTGIHFPDINKGKIVLTMIVYYNNSEYKQTAIKILETIRFVNISCTTDADCGYLDCQNIEDEFPKQYGICEYNKCICGCGDPENGIFCQ